MNSFNRYVLPYLCMLAITLINMQNLPAVAATINTADRFQKTITNAPMVVAYVYDSGCADCNKDEKKCRKATIKKNIDIIRATSKNGRYANADIKFITADANKGSLSCLDRWYNLGNTDNFLFFKKGKVASDVLFGDIERDDLESRIENNWQDDINGILGDKEEERKLRIAENRAAWAYWGTGYWFGCGNGCYGTGYWGGCGAPYNWGCDWNGCGRGPYFGCNVGYYC